MKKFMIIFTILISSLFLIDNVDAESITVNTDLYGDIVVDTEQIAEELDLDITGNFILAKRMNGTDVILLLERTEAVYVSYKTVSSYFSQLDNNYKTINNLILLYNSSTSKFEILNTNNTGFKIYFSNIYYNNINYIFSSEDSDINYYYSIKDNKLCINSSDGTIQNNCSLKIKYDYFYLIERLGYIHFVESENGFGNMQEDTYPYNGGHLAGTYFPNADNKFKNINHYEFDKELLIWNLDESTIGYSGADSSEIVFSTTDLYNSDGSIYFSKNYEYSNDTLKLKNMFNSGTNAYGMSKIIWNINASSDISAKDGIINFKIQYGANDFTNKNIPIFNSYKIYGYNEFESGWTDITNDETFYFDDFIYEYYTLEGTATETVLTSTLNIPSDICVYQQIKVEFYFDNTNNFYMYVFDDLDNSTWENMQYYFENYMYYEFPSDMKYAFITHKENNRNIGKVYVPYNDIINPNSLFGAYIYDTKYKSVSRKLQEIEFTEHNYYYYYDFDFSFDNNEALLLQRKTGTDEKVSFYLPSDFIVEFANDNENITILTPNGYIDIDSGKVENVFSNDSKTFVDYLNIVRNYITSIGFYITNFFGVITYFLNSLPGEALTAIITIFIVLCACVIIKLIRK